MHTTPQHALISTQIQSVNLYTVCAGLDKLSAEADQNLQASQHMCKQSPFLYLP